MDAPEQKPVSMSKDDLAKYLETPMMKRVSIVVDSIEALASDIDKFSYDYDTHGYHDAVEDRTEAVQPLIAELSSGDTEDIRNWLQEIVDEDDIPENVAEAKALIERIDSIPREAVAEQTVAVG